MIDLYFWPTPNGHKVTIMLEECSFPYNIIPVDIGAGDQYKDEFLRLSPNNRMPAIVDHSPLGGGEPITLFESGAIMEYLADKAGRFLPQEPRRRYATLQWVHWQATNLGPAMGNGNHFKNYAPLIVDDQLKLEYGLDRFIRETDRLAGILETQLTLHPYIAGDEYSIADIATWPWAISLDQRFVNRADCGNWDDLPNVKRWIDNVGSRQEVRRGQEARSDLGKQELTPDEIEARLTMAFRQSNEDIRKLRDAAFDIHT